MYVINFQINLYIAIENGTLQINYMEQIPVLLCTVNPYTRVYPLCHCPRLYEQSQLPSVMGHAHSNLFYCSKDMECLYVVCGNENNKYSYCLIDDVSEGIHLGCYSVHENKYVVH